MAELTLQALAAELESQRTTIATLENKVGELEDKLAAVYSGKSSIQADKKPAEKPKVPSGEFKHNKEKYRFADGAPARIRIAGKPDVYTAEEVAATAGKEGGLFDQLLAVKGQTILVKVV